MNSRKRSTLDFFDRNREITFYPNEILIILLMFLGALNFLDIYSYMVYAAFGVCVFSKRSSVKLDISLIFLFVLSISVLLFSNASENRVTNMIKPFTYPICYIMGCNIIDARKKTTGAGEKSLITIILICAVATLLHYILNTVTNMDIALWGYYIDFWTHSPMSTTGQAILACMPIAAACSLLFMNVRIPIKITAGTVLFIILYYNFILAGRTILVQTMVMLVVSVVYFIIKGNAKREKKIGYLCIAAVVVVLICIAYNNDVFGIKTMIEESNFYNRFFADTSTQEINDDRRMELKALHFSHLLDYPFGGDHIRRIVGNYAHELYLDTYDNSGVFAYVGVVGFAITSICILIKVLKSKKLSYNIQHMILCIYFLMHIEFMIEPILIGSPWFFALFCFVHGATSSLVKVKD